MKRFKRRFRHWFDETWYSVRLYLGLEEDPYWVGIQKPPSRIHRWWTHLVNWLELKDSDLDNEVNGMSDQEQGKKPQPEAKKPPAKPSAAKPTATKPVATPTRRSPQTKTPPATKPVDNTPAPDKDLLHDSSGWIVVAVFAVALATIVAFFILTGPKDQKSAKATSTTTTMSSVVSSHTPTTAAQPGQDPRFVQQDIGVGDLNRVIGKGLAGSTGKTFTASALKAAGHSAQVLAIYASAVHLWSDANNTNGLLMSDGKYLSTKGIMLWSSLRGAVMAKGTTKKVGKAPANWYNTGVSSRGRFGRAASPGISGNRKALIITFKDGSKAVFLRRCGNQAIPGPGGLPVVPTDNRKKTPKLTRKIASQDPGPRGNARWGSGQNKNPGPGTYVKPSDMTHPGPTPYTPPPPPPSPPPTPTTPTTPPAGSTPDPAPTPTEETGAPGPNDPV